MYGESHGQVVRPTFQVRSSGATTLPKAASVIEDISHASRLLGHSKEEITRRVYRRVGEVVSPTK